MPFRAEHQACNATGELSLGALGCNHQGTPGGLIYGGRWFIHGGGGFSVDCGEHRAHRDVRPYGAAACFTFIRQKRNPSSRLTSAQCAETRE